MKRTIPTVSLSLLIAVLVGWVAYSKSTSVRETSPASDASWVSHALSVDQVLREADLVVRARVIAAPVSRSLRQELPRVEVIDGKASTVGSQISETVFSDTQFEVVKLYTGAASSPLLVMQTGGLQPGKPENITEMADDPLYNVGEEYVLFLVDISGDPVQAPGRSLYRIVNPAGRYRIDGGMVQAYGEKSSDPQPDSASQPTTLVDLEAQIAHHAPTSLPPNDSATHIPQPAIDQQEAIKRATTSATTPLPEIQPPTTPPTVLGSDLITQSSARQRLRAIQPQIDLPESANMVWLITLAGQWSDPLGANATYDRYLFVIDASTGAEIYKYLYDTKTIGR